MQELVQTRARQELLSKPELQAVVKIEAALVKGARAYFYDAGFMEVQTPHITRATGSCENMDTLFELDYFGERAFLCQTGQLYLEALMPGIEKVFCVGPSFRAEPKADDRHLTEFPLLEIEFVGGFDELMQHVENTVCSMVACVLMEREAELDLLGVDKRRLDETKAPFTKITYSQAIKLLGLEFGDDLKSRHEAKLVEMQGGKPLFVTHYPKAIKFFNMRRNDFDPSIVNSTDLLLPFGGEAVGAAEREYEYDSLRERLETSPMMRQLEARGGSIKDFDWYLEHVKKNGSAPHAGCGIGLNRVTQFVLGWQDIRACTGFPLNSESLM